MIYTAPVTVNTGDLWTAANQNTFLKANMEALRPDTGVAFKSASQSIANDTEVQFVFGAVDEVSDTANFFDFAVNDTRLTIPYDGIWLVTFSVSFDFHATGYRSLKVERNGGGTGDASDVRNANQSIANPLSVTFQTPRAAGDFYELTVRQTSGGALNATDGKMTIATIRHDGS